MDVTAILALIEKGITVASALLSAGEAAAPAIQALFDKLRALISGAQTGTVTQQDLDATEALLDQMIADFNADLPPAAGG